VYNKVVHEAASKHPTSWRGHCWFALWLVNRLRPSVTVDLGVDKGFSSQCFAAPGSGTVFSVDTFGRNYNVQPRKNVTVSRRLPMWEMVGRQFAELRTTVGIDNAMLMPVRFEEAAVMFHQNRWRVDLLHVDGVHTMAAVQNDYQLWKPLLHSGAVVLFHDIGAFKEVRAFFSSIGGHRLAFLHSAGLGVLAPNATLLAEIVAWAKQADLPVAELKEDLPTEVGTWQKGAKWRKNDFYKELPLTFERAMALLPRAPTCKLCERRAD
jgi:hypothetical protein